MPRRAGTVDRQRTVVVLTALGTVLAGRLPAQGAKPGAASAWTPQWGASASAGTVKISDTTTLQALGGLLQYQPTPWLTLGAAPTMVSTKVSGLRETGFGDLPLTAAASVDFDTPLSPELAAGLLVVLPTGNASCGLGSGQTTTGLDLGFGISPDPVHLSLDASRDFSASAALSSFDQRLQATWLELDGDVDVGPRWNLGASLGGDFGGTGTTTPGREVGAGTSYTVRGPLKFNAGITHRLSGDAPQWGVALSLGTATAGLFHLNPTSPLWRQRQVFVGGVSGRRKTSTSGGTTSCP